MSKLRGMGFYVGISDIPRLQQSVDKAKRYNCNHVRLILLPKNKEGHSVYVNDLDRQLEIAVNIARYAKTKRMSVAVNLHWTPGGTKTTLIGRNNTIYTNREDRKVFVASMHKIFHTFKDHSNVWGYDYNEPIFSGIKRKSHNRLIRNLLHALSQISPKKKFVVESMAGARTGYLKYFPKYKNAVYSFHYYYPEKVILEVQGELATTREYKKTYKDCQEAVKRIIRFQEKYNVDIYVGEYGCTYYAGTNVPQEVRLKYLRHFHKLVRNYGWHTVYHSGHLAHPFALDTPFGTCNETDAIGWCYSNVKNENNEASLKVKNLNGQRV